MIFNSIIVISKKIKYFYHRSKKKKFYYFLSHPFFLSSKFSFHKNQIPFFFLFWHVKLLSPFLFDCFLSTKSLCFEVFSVRDPLSVCESCRESRFMSCTNWFGINEMEKQLIYFLFKKKTKSEVCLKEKKIQIL